MKQSILRNKATWYVYFWETHNVFEITHQQKTTETSDNFLPIPLCTIHIKTQKAFSWNNPKAMSSCSVHIVLNINQSNNKDHPIRTKLHASHAKTIVSNHFSSISFYQNHRNWKITSVQDHPWKMLVCNYATITMNFSFLIFLLILHAWIDWKWKAVIKNIKNLFVQIAKFLGGRGILKESGHINANQQSF